MDETLFGICAKLVSLLLHFRRDAVSSFPQGVHAIRA